jgi:hypothetical protein
MIFGSIVAALWLRWHSTTAFKLQGSSTFPIRGRPAETGGANALTARKGDGDAQDHEQRNR